MPSTPPADVAPSPVDGASWQRARAAAPPVRHPLPVGAPVLVLAAHPDDEAIGAGRLVADHDGPVHCLTLTAGERCHGPDADPAAVARTRLGEWRAALDLLGARALDCPGLPDGLLADHESEALDLVRTLVADLRPQAILAPWRHDPHPDHEAAGRIAKRAGADAGLPLWSYPVWAPYWLEPAALTDHGAELVTCPTSPRAQIAWRAAVACHRSQVEPHPPSRTPVVPVELLARHDRQLLLRETDAHT